MEDSKPLLSLMVREDFSEVEAVEQKCRSNEGGSHARFWGKSISRQRQHCLGVKKQGIAWQKHESGEVVGPGNGDHGERHGFHTQGKGVLGRAVNSGLTQSA